MNYKTWLATVSFKNWLESSLLPKIVVASSLLWQEMMKFVLPVRCYFGEQFVSQKLTTNGQGD